MNNFLDNLLHDDVAFMHFIEISYCCLFMFLCLAEVVHWALNPQASFYRAIDWVYRAIDWVAVDPNRGRYGRSGRPAQRGAA
jgi:hypothetical protein